MSCSLHLQVDTEVAKTLKEALGERSLSRWIEILRAKVMVFDPISEHEIGGTEHGAGDGQHRCGSPR